MLNNFDKFLNEGMFDGHGAGPASGKNLKNSFAQLKEDTEVLSRKGIIETKLSPDEANELIALIDELEKKFEEKLKGKEVPDWE